jgi:hypothetical protein
MSDYKRLTERAEYDKDIVELKEFDRMNDYIEFSNLHAYTAYKNALNRLAELEDKIEQGTLIELPCKVGDTIYVIDEWWERTEGKPVHYVVLSEDKVDSFTYYGNIIHIDCEISDSFYIFGDDAFLTREEAEKRLKELQE